MPGTARRRRISPLVFIIATVALLLAVDGGISPAAAVDRWVGSVVLNGTPVDFIVLVNPGVSASWEWRFRGVQLASGFLDASVSGSTVKGTLFTTGGAVYQPGVCCRPCSFSGRIIGNHAEGTTDAASCEAIAPWVLDKK